jgi:DNA-binding FadR family transcriptional regulator
MKRPAASQKVYDYIIENIRSRRWVPGDKIPSENELGRLLETSRLSVREALNKLTALGLLVKRHGSGSYVAEMNAETVIDFVIPLILMEKEDLLSVLEYRLFFESGNIELFMRNPDPEAVDELERHYQKMVDNENNSEAFSLADFHFHRTIARATGNTFIARISELLTNVLINHQAHLNKSIGSNVGLDYHKLILDAVRSNDKELAVLMMRRHIEATIDRVSDRNYR